MNSVLKSLLPGLLACLLAGGAAAQAEPAREMGDPTRPPASMGMPGADAGGEPAGAQLQSILVSREPGGRRIAVINGEMVRQGMKVGDAVVVRVGETEVVLRRGKTLETLKLFPKP